MAAPTSIPASSAIPASLHDAPSSFLSAHPHIHRLMGCAMVFRGSQTLIIRRAPTDSYPGKWECPGGSTSDRKDRTLLDGVARELWEESGLTATRAKYVVGMHDRAKLPSPPSGLALTRDEEQCEQEKGDDRAVSFMETGNRWGKVIVVMDVKEDLESDVVKVREGEHDRYLWVDEDEVLRAEKQGEEIGFVSEGTWNCILEGFRLQKVIY